MRVKNTAVPSLMSPSYSREENVSPRIMMVLGGWNSYDVIESYQIASTEENIIQVMGECSI